MSTLIGITIITFVYREVVIALLEAGFDPNVRSYSGTPLHEAACFGKACVVRALLEKGADLHAVNNKGMTVDRLLLEYSGEASKRIKRVIRGEFLYFYNSIVSFRKVKYVTHFIRN